MIKESQKEITCLGFIFFILTFRYIHPYTIFKDCFRLTVGDTEIEKINNEIIIIIDTKYIYIYMFIMK